VYERDLAFISKVKLWVGMPNHLRDRYKSIKEMEQYYYSESLEAKKRGISLKQWLNLLDIAEMKGEKREWIDDHFSLGGGMIKTTKLNVTDCKELKSLPDGLLTHEDLDASGCDGLTSLPEGLSVGGMLSLRGCTALKSLPDNFFVAEMLDIRDCTGLTSIPDCIRRVGGHFDLQGCTGLTSLPKGLRMVVGYLSLKGCVKLTSIPEGISIHDNLWLTGCTGLTSLPKYLSVGANLYLSPDANEQLKKDAERLKHEGKIKGEILYQ
jgi:hypothetical protein